MKNPEQAPFLSNGPREKISVFCRDYVRFIAYLCFVLINITLGRILYQMDKRWKTGYLERLIAFFEKLA